MSVLLVLLSAIALSYCNAQVPRSANAELNSGLNIGEESPAFDPQHAWGPDKGSHACPMCKYGHYPGIMFFLNSDDTWNEVKVILVRLEWESIKRKGQHFKAYLIYTNSKKLQPVQIEDKLQKLGHELKIKNIALVYVPSANDEESGMHLNKINPLVNNTIIVYNKRTVKDKFVNFTTTDKNFIALFDAVNSAGK